MKNEEYNELDDFHNALWDHFFPDDSFINKSNQSFKGVTMNREKDSDVDQVSQNEESQTQTFPKEPKTIEDVIERSRELGITLPKNHMELIRLSIEEKKLTPEAHIEQIEKIAQKHAEKGYGWHIREDHNPKYPLLYYIDRHNNISAYIIERANKETNERFFAANRVNENGEHLKITSNNSLEAVKNRVEAYYTGATIKEYSIEQSKTKEKALFADTQKTNSPELSIA